MAQPISLVPQQIETWLDEFMAKQMAELHVPGVTFSLVQNGEVLLAKGYGYANLEEKTPVENDRTLFRVGSISKLFVATAIMQLAEKGLINLHKDVNEYLTKFQIEDNYPQPITIANLLTHTAGFDDRSVGLFTLKADNIKPLGEHLAAKMPARVFPPGEVISYSNYGFTLLGYIVELIAGMPFSQYVAENILQPLEMHHSSFEQASSLVNDVSIGYRYRQKKDIHQALPFQYVSIPPAGSLSATATDMAKFANAHLQHGRYKSSRILQEDTAHQMQQQQFTHDPRLAGFCYGFAESFVNQKRVIYHGGGLPGFTSLLYLFPDHSLGLFISQNGGGYLLGQFIEQFCETARCGGFLRYSDCTKALASHRRGRDCFLSVELSNLNKEFINENQQSLKRYEGSYQSNRYSRKTIGKASLLWSSSLNLKLGTDGDLSIPETLKSPNPLLFEETEPLVLKRKERFHNFAVAQEDNNGKIMTLLMGSSVSNRISWYETKTFHWSLIFLFVVIFLLGLVFSIFTSIQTPHHYPDQIIQLLAGITCTLNLIFIVGMLMVNQLAKDNFRLQLLYGVPKIVTVLLCIPLLTSALAFLLTLFVILAGLNSEWSLVEQISYSIIAIASLGFIPFLNYWNLLGFRY